MNKKLLIIMVLSAIIYSFFFAISIFEHQAEFWDSTEYLLKAKSMAKGTPDTGWAPHREIMPAVIWYPFFALGIGEIGIRVFMLIIGLLNIYMSFVLVKEMYSERAGLLVAFLMSVFYMNFFYTTRLTMYVLAPLMFQAGIYYFWRYRKTNNFVDILMCALIAGIGMTIYYNTAFLAPIIGLFLLITNKKFFKDLNYWKAGGILLLVLAPYFIYSYMTYGHPIPRLAAVQVAYAEEAGGGIGLWNAYLKLIPFMLTMPLFIAFLVGLVLTYPIILGFDEILKEKYKDNLNDLFLYIWIIIPLILYTMSAIKQGPAGVGVVLPAYIMILFPAFFILISKAVFFVYDLIEKKNVSAATLFMIGIVSLFAFTQLQQGSSVYFNRLYAFREIREAGEFIKQITVPGDVVASASVPQLTYYSEREVIGMGHDETEEEWNRRVLEKKPKYLLLTQLEPHPDWAWTYPQRNNMQTVQVYGDSSNPIAVLFKYNYE